MQYLLFHYPPHNLSGHPEEAFLHDQRQTALFEQEKSKVKRQRSISPQRLPLFVHLTVTMARVVQCAVSSLTFLAQYCISARTFKELQRKTLRQSVQSAGRSRIDQLCPLSTEWEDLRILCTHVSSIMAVSPAVLAGKCMCMEVSAGNHSWRNNVDYAIQCWIDVHAKCVFKTVSLNWVFVGANGVLELCSLRIRLLLWVVFRKTKHSFNLNMSQFDVLIENQ